MKNWKAIAEKQAELGDKDDSEMLFHECPNCNNRCNCSDQPCSCCYVTKGLIFGAKAMRDNQIKG